LIAGTRSSASYSITAEAIDAGGSRTTSASYTSDASAGLVAGISTVAAPPQTAKHGYIAQLFDITGFFINAATSTLDEAGTLQLGAWHLLDDATYLGIAPATVAWDVVAGPITGISADGLASAGLVYQDTPATVRGTFGGDENAIDITVLDSIADNFGLYAGDGIADDWQVQYFGLDNPLAAPALDPDGDGQTNAFEFTAGLIPTDPTSFFSLRIERVPGQPAHRRVIFHPRLTDRSYTLEARASLISGSWQPLGGTSFLDAGDTRTITDPNAAVPSRFYRIFITKP
jgi:hypothetical protein